jgi:HD-GYP domain-containing protein (c-di-GMP phosphodiesterase class II)
VPDLQDGYPGAVNSPKEDVYFKMNLPVSHLMPGMKLLRPVYGQKGQLLLNRGVELTSSYVRGLKEHRVLAVAVDGIGDLDCEETARVLEDSIRVEAMASIRSWVETNRKQEGFARIYESVSLIVNEILAGKVPVDGLAEISAADLYTFAHSIDVCTLSVYMGTHYGYKKGALLVLGIGSILHDLGKIKVSPEILNKPGVLSEKEFAEVRNHPLWGYQMLIQEASGRLDNRALEIVLNHHERYDGSGYPRGLHGEEIDDMAGICALADVYSALTVERVYRKAFPSNEAYEMIMSYGNTSVRYDLVKLFAKCVYPYPVAAPVLLSTGQSGLVVSNNRNLPLRPVVTVLETREKIDLSKELTMVIVRALTPDEAQTLVLRHSRSHS